MHFTLLYEDEHLVVIQKPPGILVHRTRLSEDTVFVVQLLRDQLGQRVYPVHRLDRATSGVLVLAKSADGARLLGEQMMDKTVDKKYLAIVRGWTPVSGTIDYALADPETGKGLLPAITHFTQLGTAVIDAPIGLRYTTARFSLVEVALETGRRHQIRKHFSHLRYPIIGDRRHGDVKQNAYFRNVFGLERMFLHAHLLSCMHPFTKMPLHVAAPLDDAFMQALEVTQLTTYYKAFVQKNAHLLVLLQPKHPL